jgi:branched-chain amino acid transport system ATP-binding protein
MSERLVVKDLSKSFGGLSVASDINLALTTGERVALIGPNGAGKTTFVNLITGVIKPTRGEVYLDGERIDRLSQAQRVRRGLVRTFQIKRLFRELTVADNVRLAILQRENMAGKFFSSIIQGELVEPEVHETLRMLRLHDRAQKILSTLAYGEQRLVEIAVALSLKPKVLLLDEPAAGVPQSESGLIFDAVDSLPTDLAVLLIEHDMDLVFRFAQKIVVMVAGAMMVQGTPVEIARDPWVKEIYFGRTARDAA